MLPQPYGSPFQQMIPLHDPKVQEDSIRQVFAFSKFRQKRILFYFVTVDPLLNLFAPRIHPSSLVSYRTIPEVLVKLCEYYKNGTLTLTDFSFTIACDHNVWRKVLFNLLTEEERVYHTYLTSEKPGEIRSLEKLYMQNEISLELYNDLKFPERKLKREEEMSIYPKPYITGNCIICHNNNAIIKCQSCTNLVCISCIVTYFSDKDDENDSKNSAEGSFFTLHRRHCMKFGKRPIPNISIATEPAYLRELRITGVQSIVGLLPNTEDDKESVGTEEDEFKNGDFLNEEEDEQDMMIRIENNQKSKLNENRITDLFHVNTSQMEEIGNQQDQQQQEKNLMKLRKEYDKLMKSYETQRRIILKYQKTLEESGHNEFYQQRVQKFKEESLNKMKNLKEKYRKYNLVIDSVTYLPTEQKTEIIFSIKSIVNRIDGIINMKNISQIEKFESDLLASEKAKRDLDLLTKYS